MLVDQQGIHPDGALHRSMVAAFAACGAHQMVLQLVLLMAQQGHALDAPSAAAALEALHQEAAWAAAGQVLGACLESGAAVSPLALQRLLLGCAAEGAWKAVREVAQVGRAAGRRRCMHAC